MRIGFRIFCLLLSIPFALTVSAQTPDVDRGGLPCPEYVLPGDPPIFGCPRTTITGDGIVLSGTNPIYDAHVYLYAAGISAYGGASVPLLTADVQTNDPYNWGQDPSGNYYVSTDVNGQFLITGNYTCAAGAQIYAYAVGGDAGFGSNPAIGELAVLGTCPSSGTFSGTYITMDEVTTIAAAYAMAGFATDATHVSSDGGVSGHSLALTGIQNAFNNAGNLASIATGAALAMTPSGIGTVSQATINSLANILAECIETTSYSECTTLFTTATSTGPSGPIQPTDTANAAINIAHNPGSNVTALFGLTQPPEPTPPYTGLTSQPNDFTLGISYSYPVPNQAAHSAGAMAIDGAGNLWFIYTTSYGIYTQTIQGSVINISSAGYLLSTASGYTTPNLLFPSFLAVDNNQDIWVTQPGTDSVFKFSNSGTLLSGASGYPVNLDVIYGLAIDGNNNVWVGGGLGTAASNFTGYIAKLSTSGSVISGSGYSGGGLGVGYLPYSVAIDGLDDAWVGTGSNGGAVNQGNIAEFSSAGTPLSGSGYAAPGNNIVEGLAIDHAGSAWGLAEAQPSGTGSCVVKLSSTGSLLSGTTGYLCTTSANYGITGIAIDGTGNAWVTDSGNSSVEELSNSGVLLSPANGYTSIGSILNTPIGIAIDGSGDLWALTEPGGYNYTFTELIGVAAPVVTPLATGVANNALGQMP